LANGFFWRLNHALQGGFFSSAYRITSVQIGSWTRVTGDFKFTKAAALKKLIIIEKNLTVTIIEGIFL